MSLPRQVRPRLDFVFTVCDNAAGEICPIWPGHPMTAHWGIADPAAVEGTVTEQRAAFRKAFGELDQSHRRSSSACRSARLDRIKLQERLRRHRSKSAAPAA